VALVISALGTLGTLRQGQLSRETPGVSQKMLTQTLRGPEREGMVERTVTPSVPVRVYYELTPLGTELCDVRGQLTDAALERIKDPRKTALVVGRTRCGDAGRLRSQVRLRSRGNHGCRGMGCA
jgi:DNA-binding HxlR family transcriptional regulator